MDREDFHSGRDGVALSYGLLTLLQDCFLGHGVSSIWKIDILGYESEISDIK
jgi:hypothetical protein